MGARPGDAALWMRSGPPRGSRKRGMRWIGRDAIAPVAAAGGWVSGDVCAEGVRAVGEKKAWLGLNSVEAFGSFGGRETSPPPTPQFWESRAAHRRTSEDSSLITNKANCLQLKVLNATESQANLFAPC